MAKLEDLIKQIQDPKLREQIAREAAAMKANKKFGLVFEDHIPEQVQLPHVTVSEGMRVIKRGNHKQAFQVLEVKGKTARLMPEPQGTEESANLDELVVVKNFGEPIYPTLTPRERVERAPGKPWHTLINADNFHALQLLLYCYEGMVDVIYIDPPYNTGARDWKYNNDYVDRNDQYNHSKWLAMMKRRLKLGIKLLKPNGIICITIDDYEFHHLRSLVEDHLDNATVLGAVIIKTSPSGRPSVRGFRVNHEYAIFIAKDKSVDIGRLEKSDEQMALFSEQDELGSFDWVNLRKRGGANTLRSARPKQFYPIYVKGENIRVPEIKWNKTNKSWDVLDKPLRGEEVIFPYGNDGQERIWAFGHETTRESISELQVRKNKDGKITIYRKLRPGEGSLPSTVWDKAEYSIIENGTVLLEKILGEKQKFPFPKSLNAVVDCLRVAGATNKDALIVDFFAGSGTTLHATMMLNSLDQGNRRCILVTNNEVNEVVAKQLNAQNIWQGNTEFEKYGICEAVTWMRSKYIINGKRDDGTELDGVYANNQEMKEGFEENIEYFRLDFLDPHEVSVGEKFEAILPVLWMMAGAQGKREDDKGKKEWFIPKNSPFAVLIDEHAFTQFKKAIAKRNDLTHIFLVTDSIEAYHRMIAQLPESVQTKMLYKSYLDNFKINIEQSL